MATAKPVTDGQECVSLWRAGLLVYKGERDTAYRSLAGYNDACARHGKTADEWAKRFAGLLELRLGLSLPTPYYVLVEDDNEE